MRYSWKVASNGRCQVLNNTGEQAVFTAKTSKGFLWVYYKVMGYADTFDGAKEMVEGLAVAGGYPGI